MNKWSHIHVNCHKASKVVHLTVDRAGYVHDGPLLVDKAGCVTNNGPSNGGRNRVLRSNNGPLMVDETGYVINGPSKGGPSLSQSKCLATGYVVHLVRMLPRKKVRNLGTD